MVFSSLIFIYAFLPLSLLCYKICKTKKAQNIILLVFSLVFYAWGEPIYVALLMLVAFISWLGGMLIEREESESKRKAILLFVSILELLPIAFFKYFGFFWEVFGPVPEFIKNIALPIGISFYTFQLITYDVDIYRKEAKAQSSYFNVLLYAALFHQCIAGPIVRYKSISYELFTERSEIRLEEGILRFTTGLAKKAVLANACGALAESILVGEISSMTVLSSWLGAISYTLQIYLDFSAYSDMAIGMGLMLGLTYPENFNYPYISASVTEFWRRWHISLSTFFRDYVYIPMGGNRCSKPRWIFNMLLVWALTGLWHGASWNFVLWGLYYFAFLMLEKLLMSKFLGKFKVLNHIYLLLVVIIGWVLFYFTDISKAFMLIGNMFGTLGNVFSDYISITVLENNIFLLLFSAFVCTPIPAKLIRKIPDRFGIIPVVLLLIATCALVGDSFNPFIYFRF